MPVKVPKPIAKYLSEQVAHRIKILEAALIEIHDLDNRMKMELLSLNSLAESNGTEIDEVQLTHKSLTNEELLDRPMHIHNNDDDDGKYEVVNLNEIADYEASINIIDKEIKSTSISPSSLRTLRTQNDTLDDDHDDNDYNNNGNHSNGQKFNYLSGLINNHLLNSIPKEHRYTSQTSLLPPKRLRISGEISPDRELKYRKFSNQSSPCNVDHYYHHHSYSDDSSLIDTSSLRATASSSSSSCSSSNEEIYTKTGYVEGYVHTERSGSPSLIRFTENVYIREEDDDDDDGDDYYDTRSTDGSRSTKTPGHYISYLSEIFESIQKYKLTLTLAVLILISFYTLCKYYDSSLFTTFFSSSTSSEESLLLPMRKARSEKVIKQLSDEYKDQPKRIWAQIRSALQSPQQYESTSVNGRIPPIVLLLVNRCVQPVNGRVPCTTSSSDHGDGDDDSSKSNTLFQCFISRLGQLINSEYLSNSSNSCSTLGDYPLTSLNEHKIDQIKLDLDNQLIDLYKSGTRCFHFTSIDRLPAKLIPLFHGYTDVENSIYSNAVLLISLSKTFVTSSPQNCTKRSEHILPGCQTPGQFEHQVNKYLRSLWNKHLGNEEVDALISRLTLNIIVFHTFSDHLEINSICSR
ncbi:unnamed protein product [Trichobilharzia szidati]|nr:unnamed protein product [Trichobilharzia szidati]